MEEHMNECEENKQKTLSKRQEMKSKRIKIAKEKEQLSRSESQDSCTKINRRKKTKPEKNDCVLERVNDCQHITQKAMITNLSEKRPLAESYMGDMADTNDLIKRAKIENEIQEDVQYIKVEADMIIEKRLEESEDNSEQLERGTQWDNQIGTVGLPCRNCLLLQEENNILRMELDHMKRKHLPVPDNNVLEYFQNVLDTVNGPKRYNMSTYNEQNISIMQAVCPSPPQHQTQLVKEFPVFLDTNILLECLSSAKEDPLQLLRNLIRSFFTPAQLMDAGGLGLRRGPTSRPPLDATVCKTLKKYIINWCYKYEKSAPKERELNRCFVDTISYARKQEATRREKDQQELYNTLDM